MSVGREWKSVSQVVFECDFLSTSNPLSFTFLCSFCPSYHSTHLILFSPVHLLTHPQEEDE